ncbi:MAG: carboxypeptidase regulatory-like domain-containing protein [Planctomycetes bacterium]|nr:carboxypeptidase regulatory-like domain-containing protein [Planctomycetota bacterium]
MRTASAPALLCAATALAALFVLFVATMPSEAPRSLDQEAGTEELSELGALATLASARERASTSAASDGSTTRASAEAAPPALAVASYLGRIVDERGVPVPHAYVGLFTMPGWVRREVFRSDATGEVRYVVPPGLEGSPWISASCEGHENQAFDFAAFLAKQADPERFVLVAPRGFRLHGFVRDVQGVGVPEVELRLDLGSVEPTRSDAAGSFAFPAGLPAGTRTVTCRREGYIPRQRTIEIRAETPALEFVLHPQRMIRGHVLDETGRALADLTIHARGDRCSSFTKTAADGSFAIGEPIPDAPPMILEVRAGATEPYRSEHELAWGTSGFLITLRAPLSFELFVSDAATRAPVEHFDVKLWRADVVDTSQGQQRSGPHAEGRAVFEHLLRGTWTVEIEPHGGDYATPALFAIVVADDVSRKHFVALERRPRIPVLVRSEAGSPLADAEVVLLSIPPGFQASVWSPIDDPRLSDGQKLHRIDTQRTDAEGRAHLRGFSGAAGFAVRATHALHAPSLRAAPSATESGIELALPLAARARFRFATPSGAIAPPTAWLTAEDDDAARLVTQVQRSAMQLAYDGLPPGRYQLCVQWNGVLERRASESFELRSGATHEQQVELPPPSAR